MFPVTRLWTRQAGPTEDSLALHSLFISLCHGNGRLLATSLETVGSGAHEDDQNLSVTDDWISLTNPSVVILSVLKLDSEHKE